MAALTTALPGPRVPPDEAMVEHALRLLATAEVAEPTVAARSRERLAAWSERSASHRAAHDEARRRWQLLAGAAAGLREQLSDPLPDLFGNAAQPSGVASPARRRLLGVALGGVGMAGLAGANAWWQWRSGQPVFAQAWRTRTAQLLRVTLPDMAPAGSAGSATASEILLSAQTALRATLYRDRREIELSEGEARFDVAADASRPFIVRTRTGRVEVVGTAFTVAERDGLLTVAVAHGHVRLYPTSGATPGATPGDAGPGRSESKGRMPAPALPIDLLAGDAISVREGEPTGPVQRVATADVGAWRSGWLVFDDVPLADALPAINAFRRAPLVLADAPTGRLRLTARFQAADERGLLAALPKILPLRIEPRADGSVLARGYP